MFCEFLHLREATCPFNTIYHFIQILYRQNRHSKTHILETNNTSAELLVPFEEDYLIEIRTVSDGGDGSSSEEIRIPKMSSKLHHHCCCGFWIKTAASMKSGLYESFQFLFKYSLKNKKGLFFPYFNCEQEVMNQFSLIPQIYNMLTYDKQFYVSSLKLKQQQQQQHLHNWHWYVYDLSCWHKTGKFFHGYLQASQSRENKRDVLVGASPLPFSLQTSLINYGICSELS